ncbi:hypothetical protein V757_00540 [Pelistega indica]|uniref:Uncharacterized protein n=1 Tax=Pelistega indica TaxID=1414851 RepID=V8GBD3_9BURK|nr:MULTISPECIES: hypothetical protein [Pelistega]ETD73057.1 hypothetical protein V757_00540 [Pelistega indica]
MQVVHRLLMGLIAVVVVWSLVGVSVSTNAGQTNYSLFIKPAPTWQVIY